MTRLALADINEALLATSRKELASKWPSADILTIPTDTSDEASIKNMVSTTVAKFGRIDYALNAAGIGGGGGPMHELSSDAWDKTVGINERGVFLCCREQLAQMVKQDPVPHSDPSRGAARGAIVNVSSMAGKRVLRGVVPYTASKHAVIGITKNAGCEYAKLGIRCNAVCPGFIETPVSALPQFYGVQPNTQLTDTESARASLAGVIERTPVGRGGKASEVADVVVFLCSEEASFVNAIAWNVDGGLSA